MNQLVRTLMLGGSSLAMAAATSFNAAPAMAQAAGDTAGAPIEEVVVTGTSIRGVAPIGSNLIVVGPADIKAQGAKTVQDILANVPALMGMGNTGQGQASGVAFQPIIHSLGAQASTSTLTLVDGHRIPTGGTTHTDADPNMIPENMIQRVEVLADGSSSIYGSDAVAGVVNFITRTRFDGVELTGQVSTLRGAVDYHAGFLMGKTWAEGSFVLGYTHTYEGAISDLSRPYAATNNYTALGGTNFGNFNCDPATLQPGGAGNIYTSATSGVSLVNNAANSPCNQNAYGDLLPRTVRDNVMVKTSFDLTPALTLSSDMVFANRTDVQNISRGTLTATAFNSGAQADPFYIAPAGSAPATKETVRWDANPLLGPGAQSLTGAQTFYATANAEYRVGSNFVVNLSALAGTDTSYIDTNGTLNSSVASYALNGTYNTGGSLTTVVPGVGRIEPAQTLTAANALDVWNPAATNRTSASVISALSDNSTVKAQTTGIQEVRLSTNGTLLDLPAGPLKIAVGGGYRREQQDPRLSNANNTGVATINSQVRTWTFNRQVASVFAEADIPLVGEGMAIPLVEKFEIDVSGRYDSYSDVGNTANPKLAFNWQVIDALKLRGNISTSFVAPQLDVIGQRYSDTPYGSSASTTYASTTNSVNIPVSIYPAVTQFGIPGCTAASVTCNISSLQGMAVTLDNPNMTPQKGRTWSIGADFAPDFLPGFSSQVTLWNNSFKGAVTAPKIGFVANNASLSSLLVFFPAGATAAQIAPYINHQTAAGAIPSPTQYVSVGLNSNWLNLQAQGIDASANYTFDTSIGTFRPGVSLTQFIKFDQSYGAGPTYSVLNTSGANTAFPSIATQMRASLGWSMDGFIADVFVNYTGAYHNWGANAVNPVAVDPVTGNPTGGGDHVNSNTTVDLHLAYAFGGGILGDDEVALQVRNIFDKAPPFFNSASGYDSYVASVLGRVVSVSLEAKF